MWVPAWLLRWLRAWRHGAGAERCLLPCQVLLQAWARLRRSHALSVSSWCTSCSAASQMSHLYNTTIDSSPLCCRPAVSGQVPLFTHTFELPEVIRMLPAPAAPAAAPASCTQAGPSPTACPTPAAPPSSHTLHMFTFLFKAKPGYSPGPGTGVPAGPHLPHFAYLLASEQLPALPAFDVWLADGTPATAQLAKAGRLQLVPAQLATLAAFHDHCSEVFTAGLGRRPGQARHSGSAAKRVPFYNPGAFLAAELEAPSMRGLHGALRAMGWPQMAAGEQGLPPAWRLSSGQTGLATGQGDLASGDGWHLLVPLTAAFRAEAAQKMVAAVERTAASASAASSVHPGSCCGSEEAISAQAAVDWGLVADVAHGTQPLASVEQPGADLSGRVVVSFHAGPMAVYHTPFSSADSGSAEGSSKAGSCNYGQLTVDSPFPSPLATSYRQYYEEVYDVTGLQQGLPLLQVASGRGLGTSGCLLRDPASCEEAQAAAVAAGSCANEAVKASDACNVAAGSKRVRPGPSGQPAAQQGSSKRAKASSSGHMQPSLAPSTALIECSDLQQQLRQAGGSPGQSPGASASADEQACDSALPDDSDYDPQPHELAPAGVIMAPAGQPAAPAQHASAGQDGDDSDSEAEQQPGGGAWAGAGAGAAAVLRAHQEGAVLAEHFRAQHVVPPVVAAAAAADMAARPVADMLDDLPEELAEAAGAGDIPGADGRKAGAAPAALAGGLAPEDPAAVVHLPRDLGLLVHPLPALHWRSLQQCWQLTYRLEGLLMAQELLGQVHPPRWGPKAGLVTALVCACCLWQGSALCLQSCRELAMLAMQSACLPLCASHFVQLYSCTHAVVLPPPAAFPRRPHPPCCSSYPP